MSLFPLRLMERVLGCGPLAPVLARATHAGQSAIKPQLVSASARRAEQLQAVHIPVRFSGPTFPRRRSGLGCGVRRFGMIAPNEGVQKLAIYLFSPSSIYFGYAFTTPKDFASIVERSMRSNFVGLRRAFQPGPLCTASTLKLSRAA